MTNWTSFLFVVVVFQTLWKTIIMFGMCRMSKDFSCWRFWLSVFDSIQIVGGEFLSKFCEGFFYLVWQCAWAYRQWTNKNQHTNEWHCTSECYFTFSFFFLVLYLAFYLPVLLFMSAFDAIEIFLAKVNLLWFSTIQCETLGKWVSSRNFWEAKIKIKFIWVENKMLKGPVRTRKTNMKR